MSMKNSNDTIGSRTRDLLACSAVPQPIAPPQSPCGWVLMVNGSFPHYTFECVWTLHHHPPSVLSQTGQRFPRTFTTQLSMFSMLKKTRLKGPLIMWLWYNMLLWKWHNSFPCIRWMGCPSPVTCNFSWMKGKTIPHRCRYGHLTVIIIWDHI